MPQTINETIELFRKQVLEKAGAERDMVLMEAQNMTREELDREQNKQLTALYEKIQQEKADIDRNVTRTLSERRRQLKRELYARREQLVDKLMENVRERVVQFTQTDDYADFLREKVRDVALAAAPSPTAVLELRGIDMKYAQSLCGLYGNFEARENDSIQLGGLRMRDDERHIAYDATLDTALSQQRVHFYDDSQFYFD